MLVKFKSQDVYGGFVMVGNKKRILDRKKKQIGRQHNKKTWRFIGINDRFNPIKLRKLLTTI